MYEYVWFRGVLEELADIYVSVSRQERDRMAAGLEAFNGRLARDPFDVGESRDDGLRLAFIPLLMVRFKVNSVTRYVLVTGVARYGA